MGDVVMKHTARKIRKLHDGTVLAGFAGAVADALSLFDKFESQLERNKGNLRKSAVELTKEWRTDRYLRRLEAQLLVADPSGLLVLSGDGEVIEPDDGVAAIGSGSPYALAAARALLKHTELNSAGNRPLSHADSGRHRHLYERKHSILYADRGIENRSPTSDV